MNIKKNWIVILTFATRSVSGSWLVIAEIENIVNSIVEMLSEITQINWTWNVWLERQFHKTKERSSVFPVFVSLQYLHISSYHLNKYQAFMHYNKEYEGKVRGKKKKKKKIVATYKSLI